MVQKHGNVREEPGDLGVPFASKLKETQSNETKTPTRIVGLCSWSVEMVEKTYGLFVSRCCRFGSVRLGLQYVP